MLHTKNSFRLTGKWVLVVEAYDEYKTGRLTRFGSVGEICDAYKVHRKDIIKYYERWIKAGKTSESLMPRKSGSKPGQLKVLSKDEERIILKINRRLGSNEFEIHELIGEYIKSGENDNFKIHPSVSTIYRTFKRYPLNKKRKEKIKRYEKMYPGELLHADTSVLPKTILFERKRIYLFGLIDDCTRLCYTELIKTQKATEVSKAFVNGVRWFAIHGIKIETMITDNGSEFTCFGNRGTPLKKEHFFEATVAMFNIKHKYTRPYRPQTNGKIERFWKIIKTECIRLIRKTLTEKEFVAELAGFMYRYNYQRRHGGIKYQTPLDKLRYVTEIMK